MRLFYYGIDNVAGGLENYAKTLITNLLKFDSNLEVVVVSCYEDYAYREDFELLGVKSVIIPNYKKHPFGFKKTLYRVLKNYTEGDIIQLNVMSYRNLQLFSAVKKAKIPSLVVGHSNNLTGGIVQRFLHKIGARLYRNLGKKVAISGDVIPYMFKGCRDVSIIPNGIELDRFSFNQKNRVEIRKNYNIESAFVVGQVGRLSYQKNQLFSLKLLEELGNYLDNVKLMIIGKSQDDKVYKSIIDHPNVIFVGEVQDVSLYYSAFDIQIMPSNFEGFGLAIFEGLANGLKLYISEHVPAPSNIKNKIEQLPLDVNKWVSSIKNNKEPRDGLIPLGIENYNSVNMARKYYEEYLLIKR